MGLGIGLAKGIIPSQNIRRSKSHPSHRDLRLLLLLSLGTGSLDEIHVVNIPILSSKVLRNCLELKFGHIKLDSGQSLPKLFRGDLIPSKSVPVLEKLFDVEPSSLREVGEPVHHLLGPS